MTQLRIISGWLLVCAVLMPACSNGVGLAGQEKDQKQAKEAETSEDVSVSEEQMANQKIDLNQRVIPPQVIAGSYLTCEFPEESEDRVFYGCTARDKAGDALELEGVRTDWALNAPEDIDPVVVDVPVDTSYHRYWSLASVARDVSLSPRLTLYDAEGKPHVIEKKGTVTIQ